METIPNCVEDRDEEVAAPFMLTDVKSVWSAYGLKDSGESFPANSELTL